MTRTDYYNDPNAPRANRIVPAATAVITNSEGKFLLQQRKDNSLWALPGGKMEIGESITEAIVREIKEETGLDVVPEYVIGIYSDPKHVVAFSNGEVRQPFSICFACRIIGGVLHVSEESFAVGFFSLQEIERMDMHRSSLLRIKHYLEHRLQPVIG
jgi:ADP-ribose pyrophosphatase YjhB (NUDIX family)